jgi:hypothetical protein
MYSKFTVVFFGTAFNRLLPVVAVVALLSPTWGAAQEAPQLDLPRVKLSAGMHLIDAQVA